jgi:hypothetical protein
MIGPLRRSGAKARRRDGLNMRKFARLALVVLTLSTAAGVVFAHIDPATGQDYRLFQRRDGGGDCCEWFDCRPATPPFSEAGGEMIMDRAGNKYRFDPGKVVTRPSDDGNWHVCGDAKRLKCIIAPAEG